MQITILPLASAALTLATGASALGLSKPNFAQPTDIYSLPQPAKDATSFENQAFRPDGSVLLTAYTNGTVWQLSPPFHNATLSTVTDFAFDADVTGTFGIVETTPDVFYVATSRFNASFANFMVTPGTNKIYRLRFPGPQIDVAARLPDAGFLNGLARWNDSFLLAGDSTRGVIWGVDLKTGESSVLVDGEPLAPYAALKGVLGAGVNGLKVAKDGWVWFTNTIRTSLGRVRLDECARPVGPAETVANFTLPGVDVANNRQPDDLFPLKRGGVLVALRSRTQLAVADAAGRVKRIQQLPDGYNMTSVVERDERVFMTGVYGEYFEVDMDL